MSVYGCIFVLMVPKIHSFFYTCSHLWAPKKVHAILSTKLLKVLFLNSLVKTYSLNCVLGYFSEIYLQWW